MNISEKALAEWLGLTKRNLAELRKELGVELLQPRPCIYDKKNALIIIAAAVGAEKPEILLDQFLESLEGKKSKKARAVDHQWRNRKFLQALLVNGKQISIRVRDNRDYLAGQEVQVIKTSGHVWELDPDWKPPRKRGNRQRRRVRRIGQ